MLSFKRRVRSLLILLSTQLLLINSSWAKEMTPNTQALFDHELKRLHSNEIVNLRERYAGHPVLFVNTASHCGFTGQFEALEKTHQTYKDRGLKMAGFPSNSFKQESKDEADTARICFQNFGVTFDMYTHIDVRGRSAHPIFQELARQSSAPRWNFYKYLIDAEGRVIASFPSTTRPDSAEFKAAVEKLLGS